MATMVILVDSPIQTQGQIPLRDLKDHRDRVGFPVVMDNRGNQVNRVITDNQANRVNQDNQVNPASQENPANPANRVPGRRFKSPYRELAGRVTSS